MLLELVLKMESRFYYITALKRLKIEVFFGLVLMCLLGLEEQGIYRISCRKTDLDEMKTKIETDIDSFENLNRLDINLLTGIVKSYLREMPTSIFPFSLKDRVDYSGTFSPFV